jgi:hypothetical protein
MNISKPKTVQVYLLIFKMQVVVVCSSNAFKKTYMKKFHLSRTENPIALKKGTVICMIKNYLQKGLGHQHQWQPVFSLSAAQQRIN